MHWRHDQSRRVSFAEETLRNTEWSFYVIPLLKFRVKLKSGETVYFGHLVMRRKLPDGSWEYRRPTNEEAAEEQTSNAW
ncbi:hypothetical protein ACVWYH_000877 [Bradyrhizobium sp. GM24.11]